MENTKPESPDTAASRSGPGCLLHEARLDLRLAPEDVAQILHLSSKQIVALEQDDYKNLPGPTYVRGYLRSYAQLLGLSPEKVLESYNSLTIPSKPIMLPQSAPPPQITSSDRLIKAATLGVVAIVLSLVYLWWRSEEETPTAPSSPPAVATPTPAIVPPAPLSPPENVSVPSAAGTSVATNSATSPAVTEPALRAVTSNVARTPNITTHATPAPATKPASSNGQVTVSDMIINVAPTEPLKQASPATPPRTDRALERTRRAAEPTGVPRSRMVLRAIQESWVDVRDARDNKLLYENVPAGRSIAIEGVAPFSVFLGNAEGVRVEFNGQNFDIGRYKRGQVARFTLGDEKAVNN
ncbi:RodZ domain-containing protein [Sulfuricaulis sp.]|jgi:cytoskeleton protein RodZ|uniref:RodZ domain-containing protein n=1 Tax=Sulfuricaulis sp. TaxID=2003553 RepID=UPI00355A1CD3